MAMRLTIGLALALTGLSQTAFAQSEPGDNYATSALLAKRFDVAIERLEPRQAAFPRDETLLLNLAHAYRHAGRLADSTAAYNAVLTLPDMLLDTADGSGVSSHALARSGLARNAGAGRFAGR